MICLHSYKQQFTVAFSFQIKIKSQNFKSHDFARFEKNCSFLPSIAPFYRIFKKLSHINPYIFNFYVILAFKRRKKLSQISCQKHFPIRNLRRGVGGGGNMIRLKYPGADRVKGAQRNLVIPGIPKAEIDSYVDQVKPHIKAFIEDQLKRMQPTKVFATLCVRQKKPVKSVITLDLEYVKDNQNIECNTGDNFTQE